jgi:hypothetical protein
MSTKKRRTASSHRAPCGSRTLFFLSKPADNVASGHIRGAGWKRNNAKRDLGKPEGKTVERPACLASRVSVSQKRLGLRRYSEDLDQPIRDHLILAVFQLPNCETEGVRIAV